MPAMDARIFNRALRQGRLAPGTYRVEHTPTDHAETRVVPRRVWPWARTGRGSHAHHVRCAYIRFNGQHPWQKDPSLHLLFSCGMWSYPNQGGSPVLMESPASPRTPACPKCAEALTPAEVA